MSELAERRSSETAVVNIHVDQDAPQPMELKAPFAAYPAMAPVSQFSYPASSFSTYGAPVFSETYAAPLPTYTAPMPMATSVVSAPVVAPIAAPVVAPMVAPVPVVRPVRVRGGTCCFLDDQRYAAIKQNKSFQPLAAFLTFVSLILFIIACANEEWVVFDRVVLTNTAVTNPNSVRLGLAGEWVTGSGRRGLWTACIRPYETSLFVPGDITPQFSVCTRIDRDCNAPISVFGNNFFDYSEGVVTHDYPSPGSCAKFNAVRAFSLLAIFFAFGAWIAQLIASWKTAARGQIYLIQEWIGITFGFAAAIWGMIAMAIARSYYGSIAIHQWGMCFWLTVIAWPLILLSTILFIWPSSRVLPWPGFASILSLIALTFFITSIASNEMVYYTRSWVDRVVRQNVAGTEPIPSRVMTDSITVGLWKQCNNLAGAGDNKVCTDISTSCDWGANAGGMCTSYRAMRALIIIAAVFSLIAFIMQVVYQCNPKVRPHWGAWAAMIAAASGYIATCLAVDWYVAPASFYGYSFWLNLVGWVFILISAPLTYLTWWDHRVRWQALATYFGFVALIFFITSVSTTQWAVIQQRDLPLFADQWTRGSIPAQFGLWRMCLNFNCIDIDTTTNCAVDYGNLPNWNDCQKWNAVRAFALLTTIFAFFWFIFQYCAARGLSLRIRDAEADIVRSRTAAANQGIIVKVPETVAENVPWLAVVIGIFVFIFGTITIAVAQNYFDVYSREFGQSYWLFLTAWLVVFIFVIMTMRNYYADRHQALGTLVTLIAFIFFIIGTVTPQFWRIDYANPANLGQINREADLQNEGNAVDRYSDRIGLFHKCFKTGVDHNCQRIDRTCHYPNTVNALPRCSTFMTIRAFAVLACIFSGLALLLMVFHAPCFKRQLWWTRLWGAIFAFMAAIFGLIAMAVALDYFSWAPTPFLGYGFWLITIAWPLVFFAGFIFYYAFYNPKPIAPPRQPKYKFVGPVASGPVYSGYAAAPMAAPTVAVATNYASY